MYAAIYFHVPVRGHYYTAGYLQGLALSCCGASKLLIMVRLMRCWPGTAALGSWVLLSASAQESAEDVINWNILMQIWIGIKQQCREACLHVCSPSCRTSVMKAAVRPHSSVVSLLALTILMNISENTRVNGVKELVQVDQLIICNYIMEITCRAERMWRVSKAVQHYSLSVPDCVDISHKWSHIYTTMLSPEAAKCFLGFFQTLCLYGKRCAFTRLRARKCCSESRWRETSHGEKRRESNH